MRLAACCLALTGCGGLGPAAEDRQQGNGNSAGNVAQARAAADAEITATPGNNTLCRAGELFVFACRLEGGAMVAVCAGRSRAGGSYAQYRHGRPDNVDLSYPAQIDSGPATLAYAFRGYSGGGESQIRFRNRGVEYLLYSAMERTGFGSDGHNDPAFEGGLLVRQGNRTISRRSCLDSDQGRTRHESGGRGAGQSGCGTPVHAARRFRRARLIRRRPPRRGRGPAAAVPGAG